MSSFRTPSFAHKAARYDELRPTDDNWWEVFGTLVRECELIGQRVLDVGCGTGRLSEALAERAKVWGVDPSPEMLAVARKRVPRGVGLKLGRAERLPFRGGTFDRAVFHLVLHLVDRPRALAESRRVLVEGGRVAIATFDPSHFDEYWLNRFFPSLEATDRARFPTPEELSEQLLAAGFEEPRLVHLSQNAALDRDDALDRVRARHISTLDLLDGDEYAAGLARVERELPDRVCYRLEWIVATAARAASGRRAGSAPRSRPG